MYARVIRPAQKLQPRLAQNKVYTAPVAGWVSNRALANPSELGVKQGAAVMDNFFPRSGTCKLRRGKQRYATLENTTIPVTAMFSYRNGQNRKLFGANEEKIYDLTTVLAPYSAEFATEGEEVIETEGGDPLGFASTDGLDVIEGFSGGDWVVVQFATTGNTFLIGVNGEDDGFLFDGAEFWPNMPGGVYTLNYDAGVTDFTVGETVTGGSSSATGKICQIVQTAVDTGTLYLYDVTGTFTDNEAVTSAGGSAVANGTQTLASPGVTFGTSGLTTADMAYVFVYRNRLWFIQKDSLVLWYMDNADAIGGMAAAFPMSGIFGLGGSIMFGQGWSFPTGAMGGLSEQCVLVSSEGEAAIFQGDYPGTAETWNKVGTYQVGKPLGKKAFIRGGGDLAIATSVGLVPLSKAITLDVTSLAVATVSYNIADAWSDAIQLRGLAGWVCQLWPESKMAVVSPPDLIGSTFPVLFVANAETGAWCRFTGWRAHSMEVFEGQLYFGSDNGEVYKANVGGLDDGKAYTGTVIPLFEDMGTPSAVKVGQIVRAASRSNAVVNQQCSINFDFDELVMAPPDASLNTGTNTWDAAVWGQSVWGQATPSVINQGWQSGGGYGYTLAPVYQVTSGSLAPVDDDLIRLEITYSIGELVT